MKTNRPLNVAYVSVGLLVCPVGQFVIKIKEELLEIRERQKNTLFQLNLKK